VACTGGNFGSPGWFLNATYRVGTVAMGARGIVAADSQSDAIPRVAGEVPQAQLDDISCGYEAVDLDGDGVDEILERCDANRHGYMELTTSVLHLYGRTLVRISGPLVSFDDSGADPRGNGSVYSCDGTVAVEGRHLVVTIGRIQGKPEDCLPVGKHVFELRGAQLAEI
jgi:hypothetical protein